MAKVKHRKPRRETISQRLERVEYAAFNRGYARGKRDTEVWAAAKYSAEERKERRLALIRCTADALARSLDASAHALQFVTKEGAE